MEIFYKEFHRNGSRYVDSVGRDSCKSLSIVCLPIFKKFMLSGQHFIKDSYTEFYENPMLVYEHILEGCRDMVCTEGVPCVFIQNACKSWHLIRPK